MSTAPARVSLRFIILMGFLIASSALAVDAMLTSLPAIGDDLSPNHPERAHLTISLFFAGIAFGTLIWGPFSDALGRRTGVITGLTIYGAAAIIAVFSSSLEIMLAARFFQGFGSSAMRIMVNAIVRDQYSGRMMARISSFITLLFVVVPGVAPLLGYWISSFAGWRGVFWAFAIFAAFGLIWFLIQQPETLPKERRRPIRPQTLWDGISEVFGSAHNRLCIAVQALAFGGFYAFLTSIQQIFEITFDRAEAFPYLMGAGSLLGGLFSLANAWAVMRFGMVGCLRAVLGLYVIATAITALIGLYADTNLQFIAFLIWMVFSFTTINIVGANIIALALQPLPHIAGLATSVQISTGALAGTLISIPVSFAFDGSIVPLVLANLVTFGLAQALTFRLHEMAEE